MLFDGTGLDAHPKSRGTGLDAHQFKPTEGLDVMLTPKADFMAYMAYCYSYVAWHKVVFFSECKETACLQIIHERER